MANGFHFATDLVQADPWPIARHVFIIAEVGINHNGDIGIAKRLIDMAHNAGADAVKFQKRTIDVVYTQAFLSTPRESPWGNTQRAQKEGLEFGKKEYDEIDAYCRQVGIAWFASAWDVPSQIFLRQFKVPYSKIPSAMITHMDLLRVVAEERKPTFISAGMSRYEEVDAAVEVFRKADCPFILMHSVSEYPAPEENLNLAMMHQLRKRYGVPVGYSGHEASLSPAVIAAAMGAVAVERHITLDRAMYGTDQAASLEKPGLESMVAQIRKIPIVLGDGVKRITSVEEKNAAKLRYFRAT
jgi:N-acetylneuraminate synthase